MRDLILWFGVVGMPLLPALSWTGYPPYSFEYLTIVGAVFGVALLIRAVARPPLVTACLVTIISCFTFSLYFAGSLPEGRLWHAAVALLGLALGAGAMLRPRLALLVAGWAGVAQIVTTSAAAPDPITTATASKSDALVQTPSVVHILLDAHAGIAAMPPQAIAPDRRDAFERRYINMGFLVFRKAYTADVSTPISLARLFNPDLLEPFRALKPASRVGWWHVDQADALVRIAERRTLDLTSIDYVSLLQFARRQKNVNRNVSYYHFATFAGLAPHRMAVGDRLWLMSSVTVEWLRSSAKSATLNWFMTQTSLGRWLATEILYLRGAPPHISRRLLLDLAQRIACCGTRGTYTFAHLLLPRDPYILNSQCGTRPTRDWLVSRVYGPKAGDTEQSRLLRYRLHFEQAECTITGVEDLMRSIDGRPEMRDATVIIHGDHGSRIVIADRKEPPLLDAAGKLVEQDWRGTLLAIRLPGVPGQAIDTPVRVDVIYRELAKRDFRALPFKELAPLDDSPY